MTGPGTDDESDERRDDAGVPPHDTDVPPRDTDPSRSGADDEQAQRGEPNARDESNASDESSPGDESSSPGGTDTATGPDTPAPAPVDAEDGPPEGPPIPGDGNETRSFDGPLDWFLHTDDAFVMTVRDVGSSLLTVLLLGLVLFAVSGIWPPLVAVESGSMEPHLHKNDLVFIVDNGRFVGDSAHPGTGVVTHRAAQQNEGYWSFGDYGNVVIYRPDGSVRRTPIIHRARFWVEDGENWVDPPSEGGTGKANPQYLSGGESADREFDCEDVRACPADYAGFITKGDANGVYDQVGGQSNTVKPSWIRGKAKVRIPLLGWIRLQFAKLATTFGGAGSAGLGGLRLQLGVAVAGLGTVVARRRSVL